MAPNPSIERTFTSGFAGWRTLASLVLLLSGCTPRPAETRLRDGDIIFQISRSSQSLAIQRATRSRYSHMGMVVYRESTAFVFEASSTVRFTLLQAWIDRGEGGHYVVKRLREAGRVTPDKMKEMRAAVRAFQGKSYDLTFEWSDQRMYCSELVWKIYERVLNVRIGELQKLREFDLSDPVVRAKLRERYGAAVPLDEPVISPAAMFHSRLLERVMER